MTVLAIAVGWLCLATIACIGLGRVIHLADTEQNLQGTDCGHCDCERWASWRDGADLPRVAPHGPRLQLDLARRDLTLDVACPDTVPSWVSEEASL